MPHVKLKLDDSTAEAFHNMVAAPQLVVGHSSFSYVAAILSTAPVYFSDFKRCPGSYYGWELRDWHHINVSNLPKGYWKDDKKWRPSDLLLNLSSTSRAS